MAPPILVLGIGAEGAASLRRELREQVQTADFLAGGARHLELFPERRGERFVLKNNLTELTDELRWRLPHQRCVVLASGDPLFFGIGKHLTEQLGLETVQVEPAVSSMQLAFARAGVAWQDAALGSVHGRDLRAVLLPLLGHPLLGLFTDERHSPAAVARFFLERCLEDYEGFVGEGLAATGERLSGWQPLADIAGQTFAPLSYLVLRRQAGSARAKVERLRGLVPGVPDAEFSRPEDGPEVMTRSEVRAAILGRLGGPVAAGDTIWDIGSGLGTVAVELAVLRPGVEVVAVERDPQRAAFINQNRMRFETYNVRVVEGEAPGILQGESERPRAVFIGGSGGQLAEMLDLVAARLHGGGVLVAAFVTLEHLALTLDCLRAWGWPAEVTQLQIARGDVLAGLTSLKPLRAVFLVRATKLVA
jgi:precorrin-6Y C5,15-methyltransferase (decarboxylating)